MKKRERDAQILLLPEDEIELEGAIKREFPGVQFIDEKGWVDPNIPPTKKTILECGRIAGIWNSEVYPAIRGRRRENGRIDGPELEIVQWVRSAVRESGVLHSGRWAYSLPEPPNPAMLVFVERIWRILFSMTTNRMRRSSAMDQNSPERGFRVGSLAFRRAQEGKLVLASNALRLAPEIGYVWRL